MPISFTTDSRYVAPGVAPWATSSTTNLMVADWNGDHILDVAITGTDWPNGRISSQLQIWTGQAAGGYAVSTGSVLGAPVMTYFTRMMATADFNGDHRADIYLGTVGDENSATGEADVVLLSTASGQLVRATSPALSTLTYSHGSSVGDFDGDGDIDIFQGGGYLAPGQSTGPTIGSHLLVNDGFGNFTDASARLPSELKAAALRPVFASAMADLNGDGFDDLVVGHKGGQAAVLRTAGDGSTYFEYSSTGYPGGYFLSDGKGGFGAFHALPGGALPSWNSDTIDIRVFDANGDGKLDMLFSSYNTGWVSDGAGGIRYTGDGSENKTTGQGLWRDLQLFINNGDGTFNDQSARIQGAGNGQGGSAPIFQMFPVDLNGDGRLDLVGTTTKDLISDARNGNFAWVQSSTGEFVPFDLKAVLQQTGLSSIWNIAVFDANGDGRPDLGYTTYTNIPGSNASGPGFGVLLNTTESPFGAGRVLLGSTLGGDVLLGGTGSDTITATLGPSYLRGNEGDDLIRGGPGFDDTHGNAGNDTVSGGAGDDWVVGGKDQDLLYGDSGADVCLGNVGDDTIHGGDGNDVVRGGQGDDVVRGEAGDDFVSGDRGNDTLYGGTGADSFHTFSGAGIDRVMDFSIAGGDRVQLLPGATYTATQVGGDVVVETGEGAQLILAGVQLSALPAGWIFGF